MNVLTVPNGIVVALFGIVLSASFCDICWTKRNRIVLAVGTAAILLLQGAITFGASWDAMQELYPFTTHLPLAVVLGVLSGDWLWPTISVFAAYLCCQLRRWAALLASLSTPVLAAPAISVDAAPTAAVLEEENSLWELPQADTPDMSNTVWSFAGGYIDGGEMTQAEMDESLAAYGGTLQFTFDAAGGAKMIQGGGTLNGTYQYLDDGSVGVIFDYNGEELRYACIFTWTDEDELLMVAISDVEGADGIYFVQ